MQLDNKKRRGKQAQAVKQHLNSARSELAGLLRSCDNRAAETAGVRISSYLPEFALRFPDLDPFQGVPIRDVVTFSQIEPLFEELPGSPASTLASGGGALSPRSPRSPHSPRSPRSPSGPLGI
jgi:hypothetical protein